MVPKIRFYGFEDEWWERKLEDIASFHIGNGLSRSDIDANGRNLCILYGDLYTSYGIIINNVIHKTNVLLTNPMYSRFGDVLIPSSDTTPTGLARASASEIDNVLIGGDINILRPNDNIHGSCLALAINVNKNKLLKHIKGITVRHIHNSDIKDITVFISSSLSEQRLIGSFFRTLDDLISSQEACVKKLRAGKCALLSLLFLREDGTPRLRFPGFTEEWRECKLEELCSITTGKLDANAMVDGGRYNFYTSGFQVYKIDTAAFEGPAITIAGNGNVGCLHLADGKFNAYQRTYVLQNFVADRFFLKQAIDRELPKKIKDELRGSAIPYIVLEMLTDLNIKLPSLSEQRFIGSLFRTLDALIESEESYLRILKGAKKALLSGMFV